MVNSNFVAGLDASFSAARAHQYPTFVDLNWFRRRIRLEILPASLVGQILPALAHLQRPLADQPDLTVRVWDSVTTNSLPPILGFDLRQVCPRGEIRGQDNPTKRLAYSLGTGVLSYYDTQARCASIWLRDAAELPIWEAAAPLRTLWHWCAQDWGGQLAHAACVGRDGHGLLLTGPGGSGKSTTALACVDAGWDCLGDDYILVQTGTAPRAAALYGTAKLHGEHLQQRMPHWQSALQQRGSSEQKDVLRVDAVGRCSSLALTALVLPRVSPTGTVRLSRASRAAAWCALVPTSVCQLPYGQSTIVERLGELVRSLPAYSLELGPDLGQVRQVLENLLTESAQPTNIAA